MLAATLMVQGTASSVGKSLLVTALCRYFARHGIRVAPFKAQNMSLNAAVSSEGLEIGRAQAVQAAAAFVPATTDMNPILIKPESDQQAQLIVNGRVAGRSHARSYGSRRAELAPVVEAALTRLRERHELVLIEGAGSPAEINLRASDIVNMHVARIADAPVLLAGDIDRGGVFAALVGTLALLEPDERARVAAFVINKFRGSLELLAPGLDMLVDRTGVPVLGVMPHLRGLALPREDSADLPGAGSAAPAARPAASIAVVALPHMSNHDDFQPLEHEPAVELRFVRSPRELGGAALIVLPGSKSVVADLRWLREQGFAEAIARHVEAGRSVLGICGGCQLLGQELLDPEHVESAAAHVEGLGYLPLRTRFGRAKVTANAQARVAHAGFLGAAGEHAAVRGYEIHMGEIELLDPARAAFRITERNGESCDAAGGASNARGNVVGTMLHGLFDDARTRHALLVHLGGEAAIATAPAATADAVYDRLGRAVAEHLDCERLWSLTGLRPRTAWPASPAAGEGAELHG